MKKLNLPLMIGMLYIGFWIGAMYMNIDVPQHMTTPTRWYHVLFVACSIILPFLLGWDAHKDHIKQ